LRDSGGSFSSGYSGNQQRTRQIDKTWGFDKRIVTGKRKDFNLLLMRGKAGGTKASPPENWRWGIAQKGRRGWLSKDKADGEPEAGLSGGEAAGKGNP